MGYDSALIGSPFLKYKLVRICEIALAWGFGVAGTLESALDIRAGRVLVDDVTISGDTITLRNALYRNINKVIGFSVGIGASSRDYKMVTHISAFIWDDTNWLVSFGTRESNGSSYDTVYNSYDDSYHFNPTDLVHSSGTDVIIDLSTISDYNSYSIPTDINRAGIIFINS